MGTDLIVINPQPLAAPARLDESPAAVFIARLSKGSRRVTEVRLRTVANLLGYPDALTCPWHQLRYQHTQALRGQLAERYAPATANATLCALRGVLKEAWRLGLMDVEQMQRACDVPPVRGSRIQKGRALATGELRDLFDTCNEGTLSDRRDAALLAVLYSAGVRRAEAVALDVSNYDRSEGSIDILAGKGNKGRRQYLAGFATERLGAWIDGAALRDGPLFRRIRAGEHLTSDRLTDQSVRLILAKRCEQAGVATIAPHSMRRSFVTNLLSAGTDLHTVSKLAGHSSVNTTARYDLRGEDAKRRAVQSLTI